MATYASETKQYPRHRRTGGWRELWASHLATLARDVGLAARRGLHGGRVGRRKRRMKDVRRILAHGYILKLLLKALDQILGKADTLLAITEELADGKDRVRIARDGAVYAGRIVSLALWLGLGRFCRLGLHLVAEETTGRVKSV